MAWQGKGNRSPRLAVFAARYGNEEHKQEFNLRVATTNVNPCAHGYDSFVDCAGAELSWHSLFARPAIGRRTLDQPSNGKRGERGSARFASDAYLGTRCAPALLGRGRPWSKASALRFKQSHRRTH